MDKNSHWRHRLPDISHLLTVLTLTALGAALIVTISAHPSAPRTASAPGAHRHTNAKTSPSTRQPAPATTVPTTTTTVPIPTTTTPPAPVAPVPQPPARVVAAQPSGYGCAAALAYLQVHAAPGFILECPGWAGGHQAMSCVNVAGVCPGAKVIAIADPCPAAYMNEASNSWVITGASNAALDPYGYCH
ncbi:MAG TPA: hypothetical protein VNC61_09480 [Acidimicrobiales bacterium]|nr:hypothetical protein [Acidimicrobiales bacterium]